MITNVLLIIVIIINIMLVLLVLNLSKKSEKVDLRKLENQISAISKEQERTERSIRDEIVTNRNENTRNAKQDRQEMGNSLMLFNDSLLSQMKVMADLQKGQLDSFRGQLTVLTDKNEQALNKMRDTMEMKLKELQQDNNKKLDEMRATVDEKLHETLEKRLGESFKSISERLEALYKELGEVQTLSKGVNDLKKALTNVKTRGIWGEIQLGNIIEDILIKEQYDTNVVTKKGSNDRVEFAIKLPGQDDRENNFVYLPIDAKFPQEDYQKLLEAQEQGNKALIDECSKQLIIRIKSEAKDIKEKYIDPPNTTDFGILFLPTESLYAEVIRIPGLWEVLQREYKVVITGPTTLAALLNSLQMGFRTLAIEKRSSEVWALLGTVKTEFGRFGDILEKTQKKLQEASNSIDTATRKSRTIERKLKNVQVLNISGDASEILDASGVIAELEEGEEE
jgi:DNA recombination protein RmuC